ncbi:MAG: Ada metal-binding domain-containing protein [Patescibacteria group bacterium]
MIQNILEKIKEFPREYWNDLFVIGVILVVSLASFGLGRLSVLYTEKEEEFAISYVPQVPSESIPQVAGVEAATPTAQVYVASKLGSKYHLPWCSGAQTMKEENKIYFNSKAEAEAAGYTPALNCKGI